MSRGRRIWTPAIGAGDSGQGEDPSSRIAPVCQALTTSTVNAAFRGALAVEVVRAWQTGAIRELGSSPCPESPAPIAGVQILLPRDMPKRGGAGNLANQRAMLHSLAHIELVAIDLAWDMCVRFLDEYELPNEFVNDWVALAGEEATHFTLISQRLAELDFSYGMLPAHGGLWESADATKQDILGRLAVVHLLHEARGIDVGPSTIAKFQSAGDEKSAQLLEQILRDEITHVRRGVKWFEWLCAKENLDPQKNFPRKSEKIFQRSSARPVSHRASEDR
eukprot:TRINITY_DN14071_c0_g1_i1.p1 TRINITY_DN14071_c0_g1~~TRINITY_DN14071_c0_g1_i1.p1  ORF type:complete len:278 (+),score=51.26 TRINITY_DN14071_c0_g1_i1:628-1461(+)